MRICAACGGENPSGQRFCGSCGAALAEPAADRRKLVTSVFCDVSGSTAMAEQADTELVFERMRAYFDAARAALERHGGTVEKFIGDAVVGMFGVPEAHEDDALRACRAALEIQQRVAGLGTGIAVRIGINTGEVVAGDAARKEMFASGDAVVLGDAVNIAARLEQAAAPGEVLVGEVTYGLVRDAVVAEPVEPVSAKGKSEPLVAFRLLEASTHGPAPRRGGSKLVGRGHELGRLERQFDQVVSEQRCRLVTIVGEAGVGKSRLALELIDRLDDRARVARGGCLSYGEGITYWPVAQVARDLAGIRDDHTAAEALQRVPLRIAQLLGLAEGSMTADQAVDAVAELFAAAAAGHPLLAVVDDIHWAEPALLELLDRLPHLIDAPVLVLCLARPELLEHRPDWPVTVRLEPLGSSEVDALLESLDAPASARVRIAQTAAGNPLYAEELVAWARDGGDLDAMPTSLTALLSARLDRLDPGERDALERGAVEGELFHSSTVVELSDEPARPAVPGELDQLTRKDMIRLAATSLAAGELAYRFKHILIRDAAYRATTKKLRASLHERFADWLEQRVGDRVGEYHEIIGYHLEQAHLYRTELGEPDAALAARAGHHLGAAGGRANDRGDVNAAANLLGRAVSLLPPDSLERLELLLPYGYAVGETGRVLESRGILDELHERATALGERRLAARARVGPLGLVNPGGADSIAIAEELVDTFTALGDETGLAQAYRAIGAWFRGLGQCLDASAWQERALVHARASGDLVTRRTVTQALSQALCWGPTPVGEAMVRCEELRAANSDDRVLDAVLARHLSSLYAMAGRFDDAREAWEQAGRVLDEANMVVTSWVSAMHSAVAKELAGDRAGAENDLKAMWHHTRDVLGGAPDSRAMHAAYRLAYFYCDDGRWDDAEECLAFHRDFHMANVETVESYWHAALARLEAHRGELVEAATHAQRAVEIAEATDMPNVRANIWLAMAEVRQASGQAAEAHAAVVRALELFEQKGNVAAAERLTGRVT